MLGESAVRTRMGMGVGLAVVVATAGCAAEQESPPPENEPVTAERLAVLTAQAMGLDDVQTLRVEARYPDHDYPVVSEVRRPDHLFSTTVTGFMSAFDGATAWYREGEGEGGDAPELVMVPEEQVKDFEVDIAFLIPAYLEYPGIYVETRAEDVGEVHVVEVTLPHGLVMTYWVDAATSLPVLARTTVVYEGEEYVLQRTYADYVEAGGVTYPRTFTYPARDGVTMIEGSFESVEANVDIPENRFAPPAGEG